MRKFGIGAVMLLLATAIAIAQTSPQSSDQQSTADQAKGTASSAAGAVKSGAETGVNKTEEGATKAAGAVEEGASKTAGAVKGAVTGSSGEQSGQATAENPSGAQGASSTSSGKYHSRLLRFRCSPCWAWVVSV